jgi:hypothetical protein
MDNLSYHGLTRTLLDVYEKRFGTGILSWYLLTRNSSTSSWFE